MITEAEKVFVGFVGTMIKLEETISQDPLASFEVTQELQRQLDQLSISPKIKKEITKEQLAQFNINNAEFMANPAKAVLAFYTEKVKLILHQLMASSLEQQAAASVANQTSELLPRPINDVFNFSVRVRKCFCRLHINTIEDLVHRTALELLDQRQFGFASLTEVRDKLAEKGLHLRDDPVYEKPRVR